MVHTDTKSSPGDLTALVLAASRKGAEDPVAQSQNKSHKCLIEIDGRVMLEIVVRALLDSGRIGRVFVSIEDEAILRAVPAIERMMDEGTVACAPSRDNLADSILAAAHTIPSPFPLLVTTGDNALHTPDVIRDFADAFDRQRGDVMLAFTDEATVRREFPDVGLAFHRLKDGGYSACNLYGLRSEAALKAVEVFRGGGQFGKKHWRILKAFGMTPFLLYKFKLADVGTLLGRIARNLGVSIDPVILPYAGGPIDVDNMQFLKITEDALARRRQGGQSH